MSVRIKVNGNGVSCATPYHPDFSTAARDIGGSWSKVEREWIFDARDERRVRDLCIDMFGTDGSPGEIVTMRCVAQSGLWEPAGEDTEFYLAGRLVARVFSKSDARARLGQGVVVTAGGFCGGGSARNPRVVARPGTAFELRDVPRAIADRVREECPELVEIIASPLSLAPETIKVEPARQALIDERATLLARLAEIDALLAAAPSPADIPRTFEVADELRDDE